MDDRAGGFFARPESERQALPISSGREANDLDDESEQHQLALSDAAVLGDRFGAAEPDTGVRRVVVDVRRVCRPEGRCVPNHSFECATNRLCPADLSSDRSDVFERFVLSDQSVMSNGGALAAPSTAFLYDWNLLPIGQVMRLKELSTQKKVPTAADAGQLQFRPGHQGHQGRETHQPGGCLNPCEKRYFEEAGAPASGACFFSLRRTCLEP